MLISGHGITVLRCENKTQTATKKFLPKKQVNIEHIFDIHLYPKIYEKNLLISIDYGIEISIRQ